MCSTAVGPVPAAAVVVEQGLLIWWCSAPAQPPTCRPFAVSRLARRPRCPCQPVGTALHLGCSGLCCAYARTAAGAAVLSTVRRARLSLVVFLCGAPVSGPIAVIRLVFVPPQPPGASLGSRLRIAARCMHSVDIQDRRCFLISPCLSDHVTLPLDSSLASERAG